MTQETASRLIEKNLTAIYGYAYGRLYDKSDAEDLSQEIVLEILRSAEHLKSDGAFWGFAWKIAENTFRKFIKRRELAGQSVPLEAETLLGLEAAFEADDAMARDEQIYRLRRELSLLGKRHREICVSYYVNNRRCSSIAKEQNISVEMVKQHLFKARKLLKEGMEMERKLGEKSYDPGTFRLNFWGDWNHYGGMCKKKLPGAIMLAAYNRPLTAEELSLELGVAMPYLEEEIDTLEAAGLLLKSGKRLETNIVIFTDACEKEAERHCQGKFDSLAARVYASVKALLPQIRALDFEGNTHEDDRLMFEIVNIALMGGYHRSHEKDPLGVIPKLPLGGNGWIFGRDNNYESLHFKNVATRVDNQDQTTWFSAINYCAALSVQNFTHDHFTNKAEAMCAVMLGKDMEHKYETLPWLIEHKFILSKNGRLSANFPVFESGVYRELLSLLAPICEEIADCMIKTSDKVAVIFAKTAPVRLRSQCKEIAKIQYRLNVSAYVVEALLEQGLLILPKEKTPLGVYGVKL